MELWLELIIAAVAIIAAVCLILGARYLKRIVKVTEAVHQQVVEMKAQLDPTLVRVRRITSRVDRVVERLSHLGNLLGLGSENEPADASQGERGSLLKGLFKHLFTGRSGSSND